MLSIDLGQSIERTPDANFCIVSKDKDFEPMISHLAGLKIKVERYASFAALPFLPQPRKPAAPVSKSPEAPGARDPKPAGKDALRDKATQLAVNRRSRVIARLQDAGTRNRPSTEKALRAHIRTALGKESSDAGIVTELQDKGALSIDAKGKVIYATSRQGSS